MKKSTKTIIWLFITLILMFIVFFLIIDSIEERSENGEPVDTSKPAWTEYESEDLEFSISHPDDADIEATEGKRVAFQLLGPNQEPATEIYDGMRVVISSFSHDQNISLKESIENNISENVLPVAEILEDLKVDNEYDKASYSYVVDTLGIFHHYIIPVYPGLAFDVSYFASDDQYEEIARKMIASFTIENEEKFSTEIEDLIEVSKPQLAQSVSSPIEISGRARGTWFFEGDFSIVLTDWDGRIIGEAIAQSEDDWMTEDFVNFNANLEYEIDEEIYSPKATIIFQKDNPSGLPEHDNALEYPIYLQID